MFNQQNIRSQIIKIRESFLQKISNSPLYSKISTTENLEKTIKNIQTEHSFEYDAQNLELLIYSILQNFNVNHGYYIEKDVSFFATDRWCLELFNYVLQCCPEFYEKIVQQPIGHVEFHDNYCLMLIGLVDYFMGGLPNIGNVTLFKPVVQGGSFRTFKGIPKGSEPFINLSLLLSFLPNEFLQLSRDEDTEEHYISEEDEDVYDYESPEFSEKEILDQDCEEEIDDVNLFDLFEYLRGENYLICRFCIAGCCNVPNCKFPASFTEGEDLIYNRKYEHCHKSYPKIDQMKNYFKKFNCSKCSKTPNKRCGIVHTILCPYTNCTQKCIYQHPEIKQTEDDYDLTNDDNSSNEAEILINCRFGRACKNSSCSFYHSEEKQIECKYGSQCRNNSCTYFHPCGKQATKIECRYGTECRTENCYYEHPQGKKNVPKICIHGTKCYTKDCQFYHPNGKDEKTCKFDLNCKNMQCTFSHPNGRYIDAPRKSGRKN